MPPDFIQAFQQHKVNGRIIYLSELVEMLGNRQGLQGYPTKLTLAYLLWYERAQ